ncbi:MAG TPA: hypothetical protein VMG31_01660 [Verrucomicrobiae bacterium]|nr:hypothetical protein [Verrucomicrobiae bacterium]
MTRIRFMFAALVAALAFAAVPSALAQSCPNHGTSSTPCIHVVAAGSSAIFQQAAVDVVDSVAPHTDAFLGGGSIHHFTIKGNCSDSTHGGVCAAMVDSRNPVIPVESATYWLVWVADSAGHVTDLWLDNQVDSIVGVRLFLAQPSAKSYLATGTQSGADPAGNLISAALFAYGDASGSSNTNCTINPSTCDAVEVPADVYALANGASLNTGFSDIRPEDALFGTERANSALTGSPWTGLGYGGGPTTKVGASIVSSFTGTYATPVLFGLPGSADPFNTSDIVPSTITALPVGVEPIIFIVNRTNASGLGSVSGVTPFYTNVVDNAAGPQGTPNPLGQLFGGVDCSGSSPAFGLGGSVPGGVDFAVNPVLREPLSGTMNTTEFSSFRTFGGSLALNGNNSLADGTGANAIPTTSQESNVGGVNPLGGTGPNPPGTPCNGSPAGLGKRYRSVGTGEEVGKPGTCNSSITGVGCTKDGIGYTFYSFANVSSLSKNANYGYLTLDGVDPLFNSYAGGDPGQPATTSGVEQGELPACSVALNGSPGGCLTTDIWTSGNSFPHIRDGSYRSWSILRALCDTAALNCLSSSDSFGTEALIEDAQEDIHNASGHSVADILPLSLKGDFGPAGTTFGDANYVRSHYMFNSAIGLGYPSAYPGSHTTPSISVSGFTYAGTTLNADQPNGTFTAPNPTGTLEAGGDAGGCIINWSQSGDVVKVSAVNIVGITSNPTPPPTTYPNHMKVAFTEVAGPNATGGPGPNAANNGPWGWCGGGWTPNALCDESNTGGSSPAFGQCGSNPTPADKKANLNLFGYTCNPTHFPPPYSAGDGESIAITGLTGTASTFNGNYRISKFVLPGSIKVNLVGKTYPEVGNKTGLSGQGSVSADCAQ